MIFKTILGLLFATSLFAGAGSCSDWYKNIRQKYNVIGSKAGIVLDENGDWKRIFGKGVASIDFDDVDEREDALDEAEMKAKAAITHFMKEELSDEQTIDELSKKIKNLKKVSQNTQNVNIEKKSIKTKARHIVNSAHSLLKGIVVLCESVEGKKAEVVVGVSPKTQRAADSARKSMYRDNSKKTVKKKHTGYTEEIQEKNYIDTSSNMDF